MSKRIRIIEGTWNCSSCDTKGIPARHKRCPKCNNPRELTDQESEFDFGETDAKTGRSLREGVTDTQTLELAQAGADWFCAYCGASNRGDQVLCKQCNAERTQDARALQEQALPGPRPRPAPPKGASKKSPLPRVLMVLGGGLFFCCFGTMIYGVWMTQTQDYPGQIVGTEWKRTLLQERFSPVTLQGWQDELSPQPPRMPVNGEGEAAGVQNIRDCVSSRRGSRQVANGTHRVCRTKTRRKACGTEEQCETRDKGNGFREEVCKDVTRYCDESYEDCRNETRYRDEPVYARRCSYDTYQWKEVARRETSGRDGEPPRWPELAVTPEDRLKREEQYTLHIEYGAPERKQAPLELKTEQEFLAWKKGQSVSVTATHGGDIKQILPR
ncbi:hypothetical protein SAMN05444354_116150 [Stigmatella aurantiaca]|uniref:RanBP2-type domain-containing protein n=1 Tax=Stigmatella aurantiaca TaxID=41 RepID=A0A1H7Y9G3_STIAU|nr:hypothetical protein [Stigmatella aurantiaca]SEM42595.1 hypothetical protein SAMN05444354_116150 [Stigmatella aurantiaca]